MGTPRSARIEVRVTAPEHDAITARARKAGLTVSAYMRSVALGHSAPKLPSSLDADELRRAYANLKHAGSNLNQWVRAVNTFGIRGANVSAMEGAADQVAAAAAAIAHELSSMRGGGNGR